ncbi:MAG TPA: hypothetical protein VKR21_00895 [Solirubrobacteraceae bacterium]|nr:hypothetical protein [Solirubrobacteraceae bacterium]
MSVREREGLIARIRQIRRVRGEADKDAAARSGESSQTELRALEARVSHLEQLLEGLQDSVHRESTRTSKRISDLEARVDPAALGRALSEDARERGL